RIRPMGPMRRMGPMGLTTLTGGCFITSKAPNTGAITPVTRNVGVTRLRWRPGVSHSSWRFGRSGVTIGPACSSQSLQPRESDTMANAAKGKRGVNKMDAVRQALKELGWDAKPAQL